jgi:hypothetical protein
MTVSSEPTSPYKLCYCDVCVKNFSTAILRKKNYTIMAVSKTMFTTLRTLNILFYFKALQISIYLLL